MQIISQIAVFILGGSAIWLVGRKESWRKWGYIFGLLGQPFWIYTFVTNHQYGMLCMTAFYSYSWAMGIYNFWVKKEKKDTTPYHLTKQWGINQDIGFNRGFIDVVRANDPKFKGHHTPEMKDSGYNSGYWSGFEYGHSHLYDFLRNKTLKDV